jgi:hypothetical protein
MAHSAGPRNARLCCILPVAPTAAFSALVYGPPGKSPNRRWRPFGTSSRNDLCSFAVIPGVVFARLKSGTSVIGQRGRQRADFTCQFGFFTPSAADPTVRRQLAPCRSQSGCGARMIQGPLNGPPKPSPSNSDSAPPAHQDFGGERRSVRPLRQLTVRSQRPRSLSRSYKKCPVPNGRGRGGRHRTPRADCASTLAGRGHP